MLELRQWQAARCRRVTAPSGQRHKDATQHDHLRKQNKVLRMRGPCGQGGPTPRMGPGAQQAPGELLEGMNFWTAGSLWDSTWRGGWEIRPGSEDGGACIRDGRLEEEEEEEGRGAGYMCREDVKRESAGRWFQETRGRPEVNQAQEKGREESRNMQESRYLVTLRREGGTCPRLQAERQEQWRDGGWCLWREQVWVVDTPVPGRLRPQQSLLGCVPEREGPPGPEKASATCQNRVNKGRTTIPSMLRPGGVTAGGGCAAPAWWARDRGRHPSL